MKKKIILVSFILISLLSSCKKEIIITTQADEITTELQKAISTNSITRVYPVLLSSGFPNTFSANAGGSWIFSNGFIKINGYLFNQSLNLNFLSHYDILPIRLDDGKSVTALILYFNF